MTTLPRFGVTLLALALLAVFITALSSNVTIEAFDQPGTPGKFAVQFALGFALVVGWAFGSGLEEMWGDADTTEPLRQQLGLAVGMRLVGGFLLLIVVLGMEIGLEALGFGLGAQ
jgi:succinate dehydrogenase hydrophobic anchor subunit